MAVRRDDLAIALDGRDDAPLLRLLHHGLLGAVAAAVAVALVLEAAHEPAADPRDLRRIQREILLLRHADGHRLEVPEERRAAERPAAAADAAHELRLVAHADLPQLDARAEHGREILDELAEIDAAIGREIEHDLVHVERVLDIDELHRELVLRNLLLADRERLFRAHLVVFDFLHVLRRRDAVNDLQRRRDFAVRDLARADDSLAALDAARRLDDDLVALLDVEAAGAEIINLARFLKADTDDCLHKSSPKNIFKSGFHRP